MSAIFWIKCNGLLILYDTIYTLLFVKWKKERIEIDEKCVDSTENHAPIENDTMNWRKKWS